MKQASIPILAAAALLSLGGMAVAMPAVRVEIIDPFKVWFEPEWPGFYVRIVNAGTKDIHVVRSPSGNEVSDLRFELEGQTLVRRKHPMDRGPVQFPGGDGDPFANVPARKAAGGIRIPPGHAYALSEFDYPAHKALSFPQVPVRVHYRLSDDQWVTSAWHQPKIIPPPRFDRPPMFSFKMKPSREDRSVSLVRAADENWLVGYIDGRRDYLMRLCRVPEGVRPVALEHDMERRRLTIRFDSGEEDVVIDSRSGAPLSGSERTVPHLHLWQRISGRPFSDNFQAILENSSGYAGPGTEAELLRRTVAVAEPVATPSQGDTGSGGTAAARVHRGWLAAALAVAIATLAGGAVQWKLRQRG